jgi:NurA domain
MTLKMEAVADQLPAVIDAYRAGLTGLENGLRAAEAALGAWAADPAGTDAAIRAAMAENPRPYAISFDSSAPDAAIAAPRFEPVTVVAADGSSIEPDRFGPVQCFVINVGAVVLPYSLPGEVVIESTPVIGPRALFDGEGEDRGRDETAAGGWGVNLQRDARELSRGADLAQQAMSNGPVVLLLDGTIFPWDLDSRQVSEAVRNDARGRTQDALDLLHTCGEALSLGAYISASRSSDVVTSLRALAGHAAPAWPPTDGMLFARLLGEGERSAAFRALSERGQRVENLFQPAHQVCFFYTRIRGDVARVELPHWAATPARVGRLHATLVDQCARAGGYPRALQEAHEQAVISGGDRQQFSLLLERLAAREGLRAPSAGKQMSKRRRAV